MILENVFPPERIFARPRPMYIVPNVTIKGANLHFAINAPLTIPMIIPIMIQITVIAGTLK